MKAGPVMARYEDSDCNGHGTGNGVQTSTPHVETNGVDKPAHGSVTRDTMGQWGQAQHVFVPSSSQLGQVKDSHEKLQQHLSGKAAQSQIVYGIHTAFGRDVDYEVNLTPGQHQRWLFEYLHVGIGQNLPQQVVRRALRLQASKVAKGISGISPSMFQSLCDLSNKSALPDVPCHGSLGASGDLIPMVHAIAPIVKAVDADSLGARDVLCLINTNSMMTSFGWEVLQSALELNAKAMRAVGGISLALGYSDRHFASKGFESQGMDAFLAEAARLLRGQVAQCRSEYPIDFHNSVTQAPYSVRCAPFVLGAGLWSLDQAEQRLLAEANRIADNPLVLDDQLWHGGHFYAIGVAQACDLISDWAYRLADMLDRQVLILMDPALNQGLPRNLEVQGFSHMKGLHQLMSALLQSLRASQVPSRMLTFSCEGNNQDVVPGGMAAAINAQGHVGLLCKMVDLAGFVATRALKIRAGVALGDEDQPQDWAAQHCC